MNKRLDRKAFVTTLGAAGLGLGLTAAGGGPGAALAHAHPMPYSRFRYGAWYWATRRTAAAAGAVLHGLHGSAGRSVAGHEPGRSCKGAMQGGQGGMQGGNMPTGVDVVDAAIRNAIMAVIDAWHSNGHLTYGQAEALKTLIATSPAPIGPGPLGLVLFGSTEGAMHPGAEGMPGGMPGGTMPPGQEGHGGRHGRGSP